jgi:hypothetical protein
VRVDDGARDASHDGGQDGPVVHTNVGLEDKQLEGQPHQDEEAGQRPEGDGDGVVHFALVADRRVAVGRRQVLSEQGLLDGTANRHTGLDVALQRHVGAETCLIPRSAC